MDVQMSLLAIGVAAATAVAVYLVSVFGIREKSFEEAIAEQKKRSDDLLGTHHHPHKKDKKKAVNKDKSSSKKLKKREKLNNNVGVASAAAAAAQAATAAANELSDGGAAGDGAAQEDEGREVVLKRSHVEIVDEPEIMEDEEGCGVNGDGEEVDQHVGALGAPPRTSSSRRSSVSSNRRDSIIKSILLNKDEATHVSKEPEPTAVATNHFEQIVPKDDCELKKSNSELQLSTPPSPRLSSNSNNNQQQQQHPSGSNTPVDEQGANDSPQVYKSRRSKQKKPQEDESMTAGKIEKVIDRLALTSSEIQQLIDVLLNKQHAGDSEWINKGNSKSDSVGGLKKQLELKDKMIAEEQASVSTLQAKLKELRNEFSAEKTKWAGVRRTMDEQLQGKSGEVQSLQLRLRQVGELSMSEKGELQKQLHRMQIKFKDVQDEYEAIKVDYRNYREAEQTIRGKADTLERESGALKTQCGHLENQLKNAFASNQEMSNQLRSLQDHVRVLEERKKNDEIVLNNEYRKLQEREAMLIQELATLKTSLATVEADNRELRNQLNVSESNAKGGIDEVNKKYEEVRKSEVALRNLVNELKGKVGELEDQVKDKGRRIAELESENEIVRQQGSKLNGDVQVEVDALRRELEGERGKVSGLEGRVQGVQRELDEKMAKNDELRHKNQKLLESLQVTEKSLQGKIEAGERLLQRESQHKEQAKGVLEQVLGGGEQVDLSTEDWLIQVLRRVQEKVAALSAAAEAAANTPPVVVVQEEQGPSQQVVDELEKKSSKLEDEVVHYQGMLKQTEDLLSTLQASINVEEAKWVTQTADKDKEIERLRSANAHMKELEQENLILESKVGELEARLDDAAANAASNTDAAQVEQLRKANATLESELESTRSKCEQLSASLAKLESCHNNSQQQQQQPPSDVYTNGSSTNESSSSNNELVNKKQQASPTTPPSAQNVSATAAAAPPSPNPSTTSSPPGSAGKEKKKKKGSSSSSSTTTRSSSNK